jgi:mycothiol synthase
MLSNFFRPATRFDATAPALLECRAARPQEVRDGLRLLLATAGRPADDLQIADFLRFTVQRSVDLNDLWVARRDGRVAWATLPMRNPGRTMLLLVPDTAPDPVVAAALVEGVCEHFAARGVRMAQSLLEPGTPVARTLIDHCAFRQMAELHYLQCELRRAQPVETPAVHWQTYSPATHDLFAKTIEATYEDSRDCPALNGLRDIDDVIDGHKATGEFRPDLWLLARDAENGLPLGVLLLAMIPDQQSSEIVYLGICPAARRRGLGTLLLRHAMATARARGAIRLTLAVDANNDTALRLYHAHGMQHVSARLALMRQLGEGAKEGARRQEPEARS